MEFQSISSLVQLAGHCTYCCGNNVFPQLQLVSKMLKVIRAFVYRWTEI